MFTYYILVLKGEQFRLTARVGLFFIRGVAHTRVDAPSSGVAHTRVGAPPSGVAHARVDAPPSDVAHTRVDAPPCGVAGASLSGIAYTATGAPCSQWCTAAVWVFDHHSESGWEFTLMCHVFIP